MTTIMAVGNVCPRCARINLPTAIFCFHCGYPLFPVPEVSVQMNNAMVGVLSLIGFAIFIFGLLGWLYVVAFQMARPESTRWQLSHWTPWIRMDTFAVVSFIASFLGFVFWIVLWQLSKRRFQ